MQETVQLSSQTTQVAIMPSLSGDESYLRVYLDSAQRPGLLAHRALQMNHQVRQHWKRTVVPIVLGIVCGAVGFGVAQFNGRPEQARVARIATVVPAATPTEELVHTQERNRRLEALVQVLRQRQSAGTSKINASGQRARLARVSEQYQR